MLFLIIRKFGVLLLTVLATAFLAFACWQLIPGDPVSYIVQGGQPTSASLDALRHQFGLDQPFLVRFWEWLVAALQGDFGTSYSSRESVTTLIGARLPSTLLLIGYAGLIVIVVGFLLGVVSALRAGTWVDRGILAVIIAGSAFPSHVGGVFLLAVFAIGLGWFPTQGLGEGLFDNLYHLTLPAFALAITFVVLMAQITRSSVQAQMGAEHTEVAIARGVRQRLVFRRHVLRNAIAPVTSVLVIVVAGLLVYSSVIEQMFGLPGIGALLLNAVQKRDVPVIQAVTVLVVLVFAVMNMLIEVVQPLLDPRAAAGQAAR